MCILQGEVEIKYPIFLTSILTICFFVCILQGDVEILDGDIHSDAVRIEIDKYGPTDLVLDGIITNQAMYDVGRGMVYVLQVVGPNITSIFDLLTFENDLCFSFKLLLNQFTAHLRE